MTNQTTGEAAVDIAAQIQSAGAYASSMIWNEEFAALCQKSADEIETLRAQLTAATRRADSDAALVVTLTDQISGYLAESMKQKERAEQAERMLAEQRALLTAPIMAGYAMHYGGRCRDCADQVDGICENTGLPCAGRRKATMFVCEALEYGFSHNFVDPQYAIRSAASGEQG